jgi:vacuolar-type H+-ATPase subunit H
MDNSEVLAHLLKIEAEAAELVNAAKAEADKRLAEAEKENRAAYDERYREESEKLETLLHTSIELARQRCQEELEAYRQKISSINVDTDRFSDMMDRLVLGDSANTAQRLSRAASQA